MKLFVFDSDGVLVDSWPQHHVFLCDMVRKYQPGLIIPALPFSHQLVANGMANVLRLAGFFEELVRPIIQDEYAFFCERYQPPLFAGVREMLHSLSSHWGRLAIVSANEKKNVTMALGSLTDCFCLENIIGLGSFSSKAAALVSLIKENKISSMEDIVFVGDTMGDRDEAIRVGMSFIASGYGWQFRPGDEIGFPIAESVSALHQMLIKR